jgi:hypothetical protein
MAEFGGAGFAVSFDIAPLDRLITQTRRIGTEFPEFMDSYTHYIADEAEHTIQTVYRVDIAEKHRQPTMYTGEYGANVRVLIKAWSGRRAVATAFVGGAGADVVEHGRPPGRLTRREVTNLRIWADRKFGIRHRSIINRIIDNIEQEGIEPSSVLERAFSLESKYGRQFFDFIKQYTPNYVETFVTSHGWRRI